MDYLQDVVVRSRILNDLSTFILVSYYWGETVVNKGSVHSLTYGQQVDRMIKNCEDLRINYYFVRVLDFEKGGSYQKALSYKPDFIQRCLDTFPKYKCIFVDTDLQILRYPHLFEADADCWFVNWNEYDYSCYNPFQIVLPGAILGFANTHGAKAMLKILTDYMHANKLVSEDKSFSGIISRHFLNVYLRCVWLPESYLYMFEKHKYSPELGRYTYVSDLDNEVRTAVYKKSDLVMIHEDFETGNLDDIYARRVGRNRFPPNFNRQLGEKLRCHDLVFRNYTNFGWTPEQAEHYTTDWKHKGRHRIFLNKTVPEPSPAPQLEVLETKQFGSPFVLVTRAKPGSDFTKFVQSARELKVDYVVYTKFTETPLVTFLRQALLTLKRDIRYIHNDVTIRRRPDILWARNMDFIAPNLNVMFTLSKCSDPRVLNLPGNVFFGLAFNERVIQFLAIVEGILRPKHAPYEHKIIEYAFNTSLAVNKLRCWWVTKDYLTGKILKVPKSLIKQTSRPPKRYTQATKKLRQCGIKPPLNSDSDPLPAHYYGSKYPNLFHNRYGKYFLEYPLNVNTG